MVRHLIFPDCDVTAGDRTDCARVHSEPQVGLQRHDKVLDATLPGRPDVHLDVAGPPLGDKPAQLAPARSHEQLLLVPVPLSRERIDVTVGTVRRGEQGGRQLRPRLMQAVPHRTDRNSGRGRYLPIGRSATEVPQHGRHLQGLWQLSDRVPHPVPKGVPFQDHCR